MNSIAQKPDGVIAILLFVFVFLCFLFSPVRRTGDSRFSLLASLSIFEYQTVHLGNYKIPYVPQKDPSKSPRPPYQIQIINKKPYYFFPFGGSVLSIPYVALAKNMFNLSPALADGTYDPKAEKKLQAFLSALLMAGLGSIFYLMSRLLLGKGFSLVIAFIGMFGTQVWSTASRQVESHTWMILLLTIAIYQLLGAKLQLFRINALMLGTILSWLYFVRPTAAIDIILITAFVALKFRKAFGALVLTGSVWFCLFLFFSYEVFGRPLPAYYQASRLLSYPVPEFLLGHLISPSRGLFIFLPWTIFLGYLIVKTFRSLPHRDFLILSLFAISFHLLIVSAFSSWWGGHSFGPRLLTDIIPWLILCLILAVDSWLRLRMQNKRAFRIETCVGTVVIALSIFINGYGAISHNALKWNVVPDNIDENPSRIWDWQNAQFWPKHYNKKIDSDREGS